MMSGTGKSLSFQNITINGPGFGAMGMSTAYGPTDDQQSRQTLKHAVEIGCTFWDSAVAYGLGHNETLIGSVIKELNCRDKVFVASKCGFEIDFETQERKGVNNSPEHIKQYITDSTKRLGFAPDLYYLHRIDPKGDLVAAVTALQEIKEAGLCKYIGISECSVATLRKACSVAHIDALQIEYSLFATDHEDDGLLDTARELGVSVIAFGPLGKGMLTGAYSSLADIDKTDYRHAVPQWSTDNMPANLAMVKLLKELADRKGCTPGQLAIAWVMAQGAIPIPGTRSIERLDENFGAANVDLSKDDLLAIRKIIERKASGARQPEAIMQGMGH